jgi:ElaB/YqjD/DUF883 family membrane-anchored ribosome-binding protein
MTHAEQLERETEQTRAEIADTLDELRARMTPGHILDQLTDRMNAGATAAFARNLRDQAVNNPLPVALLGTGLAWLMVAGRRSSGGGDRGGQEAANEAAEGAAAETTAEATDAIRDKAGAMAETMQRKGAATKAAAQRTLQSGSTLIDFCREQPLVLAGVGIAMGAIIGALLPATAAENRLMGETSDRVKERARDLASQQHEAAGESAAKSAEQAAEPTFDTAQEKAAHAPASERKAGEWQDDAKEGTAEPTSDEPTLAPKGPDESRGQPWSAQDAPL